MNANSSQTSLLHQDASSATFVFYLKFFFGIWFLRYLFDPLQDLSCLPVSYSVPIGWLRALPEFAYEILHSYVGLLALRVGILGCCVGIYFRSTRLFSAITGCVLLTTANAISRGFGHLNHAEIGPLLVTWVLAIFAMRFSRSELASPTHERNSTASSSLVCATLVLSIIYAFVGISRVSNGGLDVFIGDSMPNHMFRASYTNWVIGSGTCNWILESSVLIALVKTGTIFVTVMEILAPVCLVNKTMRYAMLLIMPGFHLGAILLFKVVFIEQPLSMILFVSMTPILAGRLQLWKLADATPLGTPQV